MGQVLTVVEGVVDLFEDLLLKLFFIQGGGQNETIYTISKLNKKPGLARSNPIIDNDVSYEPTGQN